MDARTEKAANDGDVKEQAHQIASAIGDIASSLLAFEINPGQTVDGVVSLWKMARGRLLGRTEAEIKVAKDAAIALAAQLAAEIKVQATAINSNPTNHFPISPKYRMRLVDVAQRESADPTSLSSDDWYAIQGTTDKNHPDFHPNAFTFYSTAKVVADNMKAAEAGSENAIRFIKQKLNVGPHAQRAADSEDATRTFLQQFGINTLQALILGNPRLDSLKIADTLEIPMPKEAVNAAMESHRKVVERGGPEVQFNHGLSYFFGQVVLQDYGEAAKWFRMAAEQGHSSAQGYLGQCYAKGDGVTKNEVESAKWYGKAAEQGDARAQYILGYYFENGIGVVRDFIEAKKWYRKAAEQGHKLGQTKLKELNAKVPQKQLLVESKHQDIQLPKKKDFRLHLVEMLPSWAKLCIPLILASLVFFVFQPNKPLYRPLYLPPQPVYVSSYTRSDGTSVSGYYRALPGEREKADAINEPIKISNSQTREDYNNELFIVCFATIVVFIISWAYLNLER